MSTSAPDGLPQSSNILKLLDNNSSHTFIPPVKRINESQDVSIFLTSPAYHDIGVFIMQLNVAMCPRKAEGNKTISWQLDSHLDLSPPVKQLQELLYRIASMINEAPPDTGPRRFGNVSFRVWYELLESRAEELLKTYLSQKILDFSTTSESSSVLQELTPYLLGAFGSGQRLDYGTGHELSFIAFLGCLWKLGAFTETPSIDGSLERELVIGVIEPYLQVVRRLILTYTLEPAGSHGVWGLDDHSFVSYIFGSAQYSPAIASGASMPTEGALFGSPKPGDVVKKNIVERERVHNMYFAAVGFINDVKTGPFWEHSPMLFDISGVPQGWAKINKGMIKMYNAEVLSKFPVVQHFPFGSLFGWHQNTQAVSASASAPILSQTNNTGVPSTRHVAQESLKAPWASVPGNAASLPTQFPGAASQPNHGETVTRAPWAQPSTVSQPQVEPSTRAPWASQGRGLPNRNTNSPRVHDGPTRAPWAKKPEPGNT